MTRAAPPPVTDHLPISVRAFAEAGGTVILSARTGTRNEHNHIIREAAPRRSLTALAGVTVEEFGRLTPPEGDGLFAASGRYGASSQRGRLPAESAKELGVGEGDTLLGEIAPGGRLILSAESRAVSGAEARQMRDFLSRQKVTTPVVGEMRRRARY